MIADDDELKYAIWLDAQLEKSVKHLADKVSRGERKRQDEYKVRAAQDAIRHLNDYQICQCRIEKALEKLYYEMQAGQIQPALYAAMRKLLEGTGERERSKK